MGAVQFYGDVTVLSELILLIQVVIEYVLCVLPLIMYSYC
jgi:hypothetical protein